MADGEAIDLIYYDRGRQSFEFNQEAVQLIMNVSGNTGLIFNIGEANCGKSFTLNQVMDVDGLRERDKGMKLWSKAFYRDDENLRTLL